MKLSLFIAVLLLGFGLKAQDVVPKAKTKAEKKAERKKMTLEQKIEDVLPVDVTLPTANITLPGDNKLSNLEDAKKYVNETVPNYGKDVKKRVKENKKKLKELQKKKIKLFDGKNYKGFAVEKKILKRGSGRNLYYREFYVLKDSRGPMPYHREMTWYENKKKKIHSNVYSRDLATHSLLHGPYREYRGTSLMKEGYYYLGVKDGRWMEYDKNFTLLEKEKYNKGFFADSEISYYGGDSTKIKEVMPLKFGKTTGEYVRFFEDGTLAEKGEYDSGKKIGKWREYYEGRGNRMKREIQHPNTYLDNSEPFTVVEYDEKGKVTIENRKIN